jgi:putative hydroxymethylpyrimidine transport system substrate-binding protein
MVGHRGEAILPRVTRAVALLAAVITALIVIGCGDDGAEPGAAREAIVVLDFQPNAVHSGLYWALADGRYDARGIDLELREPSASTDAPKLLAAGRAEFAILDIHDLALARERGLDLVGLMPLVQRPLAAVIAADADATRRPRDLEGGRVGVTGLPSDDAVLASTVLADGGDPQEIEPITIGFDSVAALSAGRLDAATAFWNAEGVALRRLGVPTREFRVDDFGAPRYPELVLVAAADTARDLRADVVAATREGLEQLVSDPAATLEALLDANPALDASEQRAQLDALIEAEAFSPPGRFSIPRLRAWARWDAEHGIVERPPDVAEAFELP